MYIVFILGLSRSKQNNKSKTEETTCKCYTIKKKYIKTVDKHVTKTFVFLIRNHLINCTNSIISYGKQNKNHKKCVT